MGIQTPRAGFLLDRWIDREKQERRKGGNYIRIKLSWPIIFLQNFLGQNPIYGKFGYSNPRGDSNNLWYSNKTQVIINIMNIWSTSIPTSQDFPIWAFTDNDSEVVLLRYFEEFDEPITWCRASIPQPPRTHIKEKFDEIAESTVGQVWTTYRWFEAGYRYGVEHSKRTGGCNKSQAKSPFVCPDDYWFEPNESAFDERL